jgi:hypothetical protein
MSATAMPPGWSSPMSKLRVASVAPKQVHGFINWAANGSKVAVLARARRSTSERAKKIPAWDTFKGCRLARMSDGHYCILRDLGPVKGGKGMKHHEVVMDFSRRGMMELLRRLINRRNHLLPERLCGS